MRLIGVGDFQTTPLMRKLVNQVLDTNRLSYGPMSRLWESKMAKLHGCAYGVVTNSGTGAMLVALQALKELNHWKDDTEVLVPAAGFVADINTVLQAHLIPVLVDVEDGYYTLDPNLIAKSTTDKTRCIMPIHAFGQPCSYSVAKEAQYKELALIEDSCETMFVSTEGHVVGSWGEMACFSTYVAHLITTGVGGLVTTNYSDYAIRLRSLVNHGRDSIYLDIDADNNCSTERLREVIGKRFKFTSIGHSFRITEFEAALGLAQLEDYWGMLAAREHNARRLMYSLSYYSDRLELLRMRPDTDCAFMMFPIICRKDEKMRLCQYLEEHGIETRDALPLLGQPCYQGMFDESKYPVAKKLVERGFYTSCHQHLTDEDITYMLDTFRSYFDAYPK
jgi:perosamine synthetase